MKKSILALAVAATLAAPLAAQADTILYGSARVSVDYNDDENFSNGFNSDATWDVVDNSSRIGVQGSEDLGGGLSAVYQFEFGVDATEGGNFDSNRPKFVGLKGGFGALTVGTQEPPYYHIAGVTDIFNTNWSFGSTAYLGGSFNGFTVNPDGGQPTTGGALFRLDNSLYYATPDFAGFSGEAMLVISGVPTARSTLGVVNDPVYSNGIDLWNIALKYSNGPFFAGVSYIQLDGNDSVGFAAFPGRTVDLDMDQWVVGLGYSAGSFSVGFIYEQGSLNENGLLNGFRVSNVRQYPGDEAQNWYLTGEYNFGNNTLRAAYGQMDTGLDVDDDNIENYLVGYQYNLSKRTRLWVEYVGRSADTVLYGDQNAVSIGTRVDF